MSSFLSPLAAPRQSVRIRLIGEPGADIGGCALPSGATHVLAALIVLALHPHRRVTRQRLGSLLWPDAPDRRAERVRWLLSKLRALDVPILTSGSDVTLSSDVIVDADEIMTALASDPRGVHLDDMDAPLRAYEPALGQDFALLLDEERERIGNDLLSRLVPLLTQARRRGDWPDVLRLTRAVRRVSPLHEEACVALAEALHATGERGRALAVLDEYLRDADDGDARTRVPVELMRRRIAAEATTHAGASARLSAFVGRAAERNLFERLLAEATAGRGRALAYCGPAGIGKSRLLEETGAFGAATRNGGAFVARARCQPGDALRPMSGLMDVVAVLLDAPGAAGCDPNTLRTLRALGVVDAAGERVSATAPVHPAAFRRDELRTAIVDLLAAVADEQPVVVHLDDFQWADTSLQWLWSELLAGTRALRVLWCFGARAERLTEAEALWPSDARALLSLQWLLGLLPEEAGQLVQDLVRDNPRVPTARELELLQERGGGVPLVLEETVRHWSAGADAALVPATLDSLMESRLSGLPSDALRALQISSLLGSFSTIERMERVLGAPRREFLSAVARLEAAGILQSDADGRAHGHALWGEVAVRRAEPGVLRVLHRHVAETLGSDMQTDASPALLWESARHWEQAGSVQQAQTAIERGAEHLARIGFQLEAAESYERALALTPDVSRQRDYVRRRIELFRLAGAYANVMTEYDRWRALGSASVPPHERHGDLDMIVRQARYNVVGVTEQDVRECIAYAADAAAPVAHRLQAAWDAIRFGDEKAMANVVREAYDILSSLPVSSPAEYRPQALGRVMYHRLYGDVRHAAFLACEWHEREKGRGDPYYTSYSAWWAATQVAALGELARARELFLHSIDMARRARMWHMFATAHDLNLVLTVEFESPAAAREHLEWTRSEVQPMLHLLPTAAVGHAIMAAWVALGEGDGEAAVRMLPDAPFGSASILRRVALAIKLGARMLADAPASDAELHGLARDLHTYLLRPKYMLGESAGVYAAYLDRYEGAASADEFTRTFMANAWRELVPTRRLAPFVKRVIKARPVAPSYDSDPGSTPAHALSQPVLPARS